MSIFSLFKKTTKIKNENHSKKTSEYEGHFPYHDIHPDIKDLLWYGAGPYKNFVNQSDTTQIFISNGVHVFFSSNNDEPSLIFPKMPVEEPKDRSIVPRPPYFPCFVDLSPEQRWIYYQFLTNPYIEEIDIGYVFILYYGLERYLRTEKIDEAFKVIMKLRDVHKNKSFQSYSANALILSSLVYQKADLARELFLSLDKDFEFNFPDNLYLLFCYGLNEAINPQDIMRMSKSLGLDNQNYVKKYPELFISELTDELVAKNGSSKLYISDYISSVDIFRTTNIDVALFANKSLNSTIERVPLLSKDAVFQKFISDLLHASHERVKNKLVELRKQGNAPEAVEVKIEKKTLSFDENTEKTLLDLYEKSVNLVDRHFALMNLHEFYYKYRDINDNYLNICIEYCWKDINSLSEMATEYSENRKTELIRALSYARDLNPDFVKSCKDEMDDIYKYRFPGKVVAFERLAIIYEKKKEYDKALEICNLALDFYIDRDFGFQKRKDGLLKKIRIE